MDNQFPNMSGGTSDNQMPETDIFKEQPSAEAAASEDIAEEKGFSGGAVSLSKERGYEDPNTGHGPEQDTRQNINGYMSGGGSAYGAAGQMRNDHIYQGASYGNGQYQQPNYNPDPSNYRGTPNPAGGCQPNYGGNPNAGYQRPNYGGSPNAGYQQSYGNRPNSPYSGMDTSPMTMGDWVLTLLACMIPCAGMILSLIWAFGKHGNVNRRNFCRAQLIISAVVIVLYIIVVIIWGVSIAGALSTY